MKKIPKYLYGYKIYVDYGHGWEYECFELTHKELNDQLKCYRINCPYPIKWAKGRETNPDYTEA